MSDDKTEKHNGWNQLLQDLGFTETHVDDDRINAALSLLTPREEKVIRMRYGIPKPVTDTNLPPAHNISQQRIKEIEAKALQRLQQK